MTLDICHEESGLIKKAEDKHAVDLLPIAYFCYEVNFQYILQILLSHLQYGIY
ncbi:MAG: hypothetical protein RM021_021345 [Nostoc sp. EkiNYC01]|nr:hypothetical protein [Nostoc sp. EkiNYC01]